MLRICSMKKTCGLFAVLALVTGIAFATSLAAQDAQPAPPPSHQPPVSAKLNTLAHRVLATGLKSNALAGDSLKPFHLKVDFQIRESGMPKPSGGSFEEWYASTNQWERSFTSPLPRANGAEWSISKLERFDRRPNEEGFAFHDLQLRIARPVIDPLYQAANIKPDYDMQISRVTTAGVQLNCVSVLNAAQYAGDTNPDWLFPTMCFDADLHLRLTVAGNTTVQFDDIQMFQNRAVARDVKVITQGELLSEMKVTLLEAVPSVDPQLLKPSKDAAPEPYTIEPGFPMPESVFEVAAPIPIEHAGQLPFRGTIQVPVRISKEGSVKVIRGQPYYAHQQLIDSIELTVNKWKFKPYLVDGQPVEVGLTIHYVVDGKPFVASYDKPKPPAIVTAPEDYSSAWDPKRDPEKDLQLAMADAAKAHKRILLDVGGDWCSWCKILDKFLADHQDLHDLLNANFVVMKVNMSSHNENAAFLSQYPKIPGYPFLFVLDADGKLVTSENTDLIEDGHGSYKAKAIMDFLLASKGQ